jgi:hypothetical protein
MLWYHCAIQSVYTAGILYCLVLLQYSPRSILYAAGLTMGSPQYVERSLFLTKYFAFKEAVEICLFLMFIYVWRPRDWPQFFTLDVPSDPSNEGLFPINLENLNVEERNLVRHQNLGVLQQAKLSDSFISKSIGHSPNLSKKSNDSSLMNISQISES